MVRPAIIENMRRHPNERHVLHIRPAQACMFADISGLEIVELEGGSALDGIINLALHRKSKELYEKYSKPAVYSLSRPCAEYEMKTMPFVDKSRQEIFCDVVGVDFDMRNYRVGFFDHEMEYADVFLKGMERCIGIHAWSIDDWRNYRFTAVKKGQNKMYALAEYVAGKFDGYVVLFDHERPYYSERKNIVSLVTKNVRNMWAVMSRMILGVGIDSFGVHAMGSVGVPVYGIYGPTDPACRLKYKYVASSADWCRKRCKRKEVLQGGFCWYKPCQHQTCINNVLPSTYWKDIKRKLGRFLE